MNTKFYSKVIVALLLTLLMTMGSGLVAHEMGLAMGSTAHACGHTGSGGGDC
jgi:hypothetical protein